MQLNSTKILSLAEIRTVLAELGKRARRSVTAKQRLVIFRLATCCGLRANEIALLALDHLRTECEHPYIKLLGAITKYHRAREVPLWWDEGTMQDMAWWKTWRLGQGAQPAAPVVYHLEGKHRGEALSRVDIWYRYKTALRILGPERASDLHTHSGRHSFVSHMLKHHSLAEVQEAAGHRNVATTGLYAHLALESLGDPEAIF